MTRSILYGVLLGGSLAMLMFLSGFLFWQFGLSLVTSLFYSVAGSMMLLAFGVLLLMGSWLLLRAVYGDLVRYFYREHRVLRQLLMLHSLHRSNRQRLMMEKRQQLYWSQFNRQRLLAANDKKHSHALFKAIESELKNTLAPDAYKTLHRDLRRFYKQANAQAMLNLRDQALCHTSVAG